MDFRIPEREARRLADLAARVAERRPHDPHVGRVLLDARDEGVRMVVTDRELVLRSHCWAEVTKAGAAAIDVGLLRAVFERTEPLPEGADHGLPAVRFSSGPSAARITIERASTTYVVPGHPVGALPSLVTPVIDEAVEIPTELLRAVLAATLATVSLDDTRIGLCGVRLEVHGPASGGLLRAVSTDGHRLSLCERELPVTPPEQPPRTLPRKGAAVLERLLADAPGPLRFSLGGRCAVFGLGWASITMEAVSGEFPEYEQIVPRSWTTCAVVSRSALTEAARGVVALAAERSTPLSVLVSDGSVLLQARQEFPADGVCAEARHAVAADVEGDGIEVGLNGQYLVEGLEALCGEVVRVELGSALTPIVLRPEGSGAYVVLMPMRLDSPMVYDERPHQPSSVRASRHRPRPKKKRRRRKKRKG